MSGITVYMIVNLKIHDAEEYKIYEKSERDIGPPGCPEFAFLTPSITRPFIILTVN